MCVCVSPFLFVCLFVIYHLDHIFQVFFSISGLSLAVDNFNNQLHICQGLSGQQLWKWPGKIRRQPKYLWFCFWARSSQSICACTRLNNFVQILKPDVLPTSLQQAVFIKTRALSYCWILYLRKQKSLISFHPLFGSVGTGAWNKATRY